MSSLVDEYRVGDGTEYTVRTQFINSKQLFLNTGNTTYSENYKVTQTHNVWLQKLCQVRQGDDCTDRLGKIQALTSQTHLFLQFSSIFNLFSLLRTQLKVAASA